MANKAIDKNVVVAVFKVESEGFQALTELRQAAGGETYIVSAAALVKKADGVSTYLDGFDTGLNTRNDAMIGGLIGMMVGILAGPLGILLGGSYGALIGATVDSGDALFGASMLDQIAGKLDDGMVALVALTGETSEGAIDKMLSKYDTVIVRFDAEAVADEVDRAYEKQAELARQAKADLRKEKKEKRAAKFEAGADNAQKKAEEQAGAMADKVSSAADKLADAIDGVKEKTEEAKEKLEENQEILKEGFSK